MGPEIRPEIRAALRRWQEVLAGAGLGLAGIWLFAQGGWLFQALGLALAAAGASWAVTGLRRLRFRRQGLGPGVVDLLEGQISYLSPEPGRGGFVSIPEITAIRLLTRGGERAWRFSQAEGPVVLIPADALGAERLFDLLATLPGLDMPAALAALDAPGDGDRPIWTRPRARVAGPPQGGPG